MPLLRYFTFCMSRSKPTINKNCTKSFTDHSDLDVFYTSDIPQSIKELLVYIAREGVAVVDLFRRPGNTQQIKSVIHQVKRGECIDWTKYNFYTLANIAKRYLLQIDKGILGTEVENELIATLDLPDDQSRIESMNRILESLSSNVRQLLALLFGTWFRMIYHSEVNAMSVEAVAKSVAGSIFPSCTINPNQVNKASKVMEYLITGFASSELFGASLIEYFTNETQTSISRTEKFKYEFVYPKNVSKKKSTRLFVRMLLEESAKHGFDLLTDEVTEDRFNSLEICVRTHDQVIEDDILVPTPLVVNGNEGDVNTRKRRLSKTMTYPYEKSRHPGYRDQVQQTSEKRTCVTASATDVGLTTTSSTTDFDVSQECVHRSDGCPSSPTTVSSKTARMELSNDLGMDEAIRAELRKMEVESELRSDSLGTQQNGGRYSSVKLQQLERLQKRSVWFLSAPAGCKSDTLMALSPTEVADIVSATDSRPMSVEVHTDDVKRGKGGDRNSQEVQSCLSAQISLSEPRLFQPYAGDHNNNLTVEVLKQSINIRESDLSQEEVEVRYFVVQKYYGPCTARPEE